MTEFSIPRVAVPASLLLTAGGRREGEIYVMEPVPQHAGPEGVGSQTDPTPKDRMAVFALSGSGQDDRPLPWVLAYLFTLS